MNTLVHSFKILKTRLCAPVLLAFLAFLQIGIASANAHQFAVAILQSPEADPNEAQEFINGFLLATKECDAHANEESDGHLGGLDVYVNIFEATLIADFAARGIDIIVLNSTTDFEGMVGSVPQGTSSTPVILVEGNNPFEQAPNASTTIAFKSSYQMLYGSTAASFAASGYIAARRIDIAVRLQGGIADYEALLSSFALTTNLATTACNTNATI